MPRLPALAASSLRLATSSSADFLPAALFVVLSGVPGCDAAGIAVLRERSPITVAATHLPVRWLIELQYQQAAGPCWQAMVSYRTVAVDDVADREVDEGWLGIARTCEFSAVLAIPLHTSDGSAAVLQLCTLAPGGWSDEDRKAAAFLATYVGPHLPPAGRGE